MQSCTIVESDVTNRYDVIYGRDVSVDEDVIIRGQYLIQTYLVEAGQLSPRNSDFRNRGSPRKYKFQWESHH